MKHLEFAFLFLSLPLALSLTACNSVAVTTDAIQNGRVDVQPVEVLETRSWNGTGLDQDTETGAMVMGRVPMTMMLDQGRRPGTFEAPPAESSISYAPQAWDLTILAGYRNMSSGAWNELENQAVIGLEAAFYTSPTSKVGVEAGIQGSYSRDGERSPAGEHYNLDGSVGEIYVGGRSRGHFGDSSIRYATGLGIGLIRADREDVVNGVVERGNDVSITFYWHMLIGVDLGPGIFLGFDLRADFGSTMTINGNSGSANYLQGAFALGFDL